ncbi:protein PPP4R3C1-like [Arvicanthis niloticus]|uniref:protein PPP4R3C1-like n=1 Tax=Arvicanthis niloticus TaxID=61156 RepID=UPI0014864EB5|nr:protein PPP4R3C-like [Arvicanthis niloticus]
MWPSKARPEINMDYKVHKVVVYVMVEVKQWKVIGAGQISSKYIERLSGVCLLVHSEPDGSPIMEYKILPNVPYQKYQEEVIIWSEAKTHGMAIHFLTPNGCQEIWKVICEVQGKDPSVEVTQELTDDLETFEELPPIKTLIEMSDCELHSLENVANLFFCVDEMPNQKERLVLIFKKESYIKKLLQLFKTCEKHQNLEGLHYLNSIIKRILFLNDTCLFKMMFSDEFIMDVIGCLEHGPGFDQPKRHRNFLTQNAKFKEVLPIMHSELKQKIHQTYRMQYVHDIMLPTPSIFEADHLSNLTAMIFFNKIEIVTMLQKDKRFLLQVFSQLKDNTVGDERRHELLLFFKEFCAFVKTLQSHKKHSLLKSMIRLGIMSALKSVVYIHDYKIQVAALEIFANLVKYCPCLVRAYAMKEAQDSEDNDELIINVMIEQMICDANPEFSLGIIMTTVLHILLDIENIRVTAKKRKFLNFFYTHCMSNLIAPILSTRVENDSDNNRANICHDDYQNAQMLGAVLELLTFCVQCHSTYIKSCILSNNLLSRILVLMNSKHTFLILSAVRFMRKMIGLKDEIYNLYIIKKNLFEPVINAFVTNGTRYNMLNSAIIELFEFIREENIKSLIANIVEKFFVAFESIEYVQTFKGLKTKYEEEKKRERQIRRHLYKTIYPKIYCRRIKFMKVKVKADICCRGIRAEDASLPMENDLPSRYDIFMKIKKTNKRKNEIEHPKRKSSEASKCCPSHGDTSANRMSRSSCNSLVTLVDYPYDSDGENDNDPYGNEKKMKSKMKMKNPPQKDLLLVS